MTAGIKSFLKKTLDGWRIMFGTNAMKHERFFNEGRRLDRTVILSCVDNLYKKHHKLYEESCSSYEEGFCDALGTVEKIIEKMEAENED
ncbi:MAG: hypothetical protein PUF37_00835 [Prevotellaceae bacterium]|nr:hypothetical protein [Prevotellaceae bacterium]